NLGMMRNAIAGFAQARGEFVLKLDDDDRLHPDALAKLVAPLLAHPELTLSFASFDLIDAEGRPLAQRTAAHEAHSGRDQLSPGRHQPFDRLVACGAVGLVCALVRRDAVDWDAVPDDVATAYDRHIALQAARHGAAAWYVDRPLASYRIHDGADSVTAATRQSLGSLRAIELALAAGDHTDRAALLQEAQQGALRTARLLLREARPRQAIRVVAEGRPSTPVRSARGVLWRAVRRRPDRALLRLAAVASLPTGLARRVARHRQAAHERRDVTLSRSNSSVPRRSSRCRADATP
ncbi:MAG: glycosyltransferase, partial [Micrococcales bacterium]|nr:glycosyltransferase [Micrococcales bacterium]